MKPLLEYARDHTAVKQERAHIGVEIDGDQKDENHDFTESMLDGTGIDANELYVVVAEVMKSVGQQMALADDLTMADMLEIIGSVWVDGVVFGACFVRDNRNEKAASLWTP